MEFWQRRCLKNGVKVSDLDPKEHHCFAPNDATARMESNPGTFESTSHKTKAKEPIVLKKTLNKSASCCQAQA